MTPLTQGLIAGGAFGVVSVGLMCFLSFPDKRAALLGAFTNRFGVGLIIPLVSSHQPGWLVGTDVGLLLSLPSAIITKAYVPIIVVGTAGGALIGWLSRGFH
ncbi:MAG: hypothetical protein EXS32_03720 [Opitutus sp.]|nr:hypothetical protein [Opitutus sp.]